MNKPSPSRTLRRVWLAVAMVAFVIVPSGRTSPIPDDAVLKGETFLVDLLDVHLGLLPEYRGANVYWLFHDNYLAAKVLAVRHPDTSITIMSAIHRERIYRSGKIELLFGEAEKPLPFRQYQLMDVRNVSNKLIRTEMVTDRVLEGWQEYADLLLLACIAEPSQPAAREYWESAMRMWDGSGFLDAAAKHDQHYATYKLGLALLAAHHLSSAPELPPGLFDKLLALQDVSGGWITDYDAEGKKLGKANVETTCLCILGLEAVTGCGQLPAAVTPAHLRLDGMAGVCLLPPSQLLFSEQEWGALGEDKSVNGTPLAVGGKSYARGLGTHAASKLVYSLEGNYQRFDVLIGVDDEMRSFGKSSVIFKVLGDDEELFNSGVMRNATPPRHVSIPVSGVEDLSLVVTDAGDGISGDHADWIEPTLYRSNGTMSATGAPPKTAYDVSVPGFRVHLSTNGEVVGFGLGQTYTQRAVRAGTQLLGCRTQGAVHATELAGGGLEFARTLTNRDGQRIFLHERFTPSLSSVRWEVEIRNASADWSTPVITTLKWPDPERAKIWSAWQDPLNLQPNVAIRDAKISWNDPLVARSFGDASWDYGEPVSGDFSEGDIITVPIVTVLAPEDDFGLSLVQSPEDPLVEMKLITTAEGRVSLIRSGQRFSRDHTVRWAVDLVPHRGDWRPGLAWMAKRYPEYFDPPNPHVQAMAGAGAYTGNENPVDVERLKQMDFRILWKLSDDYAYMGMFLPPLTKADARWERTSDQGELPNYKLPWTSFRRLNDFAKYLRGNGFFLLNYFNTTEFGRGMTNVYVSPRDAQNPDLWKNPSAYLKARMPDAAIKPVAESWQGGWAVDPGDPAFMNFLMEQARRYLTIVPDSAGLCIDRADYLAKFNVNADDGVSWHNSRPARALTQSWRKFMERLGPMMHENDKVIFCNLMDPRLDLARQIDGVYDEFGNRPAVLNGAALLCLHKPLLAWTSNDDPLSDPLFQRHLYLGAFPTAPYPHNNHCIQPSPERDKWYLDYGPLFDLLRGKNWVLEAHCVEIEGGRAKANLFQVTRGWVAPVVFGGTNTIVTLRIRNVTGLKENAVCQILYPGSNVTTSARLTRDGEYLDIQVPLQRGCAMVSLSRPD